MSPPLHTTTIRTHIHILSERKRVIVAAGDEASASLSLSLLSFQLEFDCSLFSPSPLSTWSSLLRFFLLLLFELIPSQLFPLPSTTALTTTCYRRRRVCRLAQQAPSDSSRLCVSRRCPLTCASTNALSVTTNLS